MTEINRLRQKIEWLKQASTFEKPAAAESTLHTALAVLESMEKRLQMLEEKTYAN